MREPYSLEHGRSVNRRATSRTARPGFAGLIRWFVSAWVAEMPDRIHARGVWHDQRMSGDPEGYVPVGGSLIGAPQDNVVFMSVVYGSPFRLEHPQSDGRPEVGETYASPMRATIAHLERNPRHTLKAAWLRALGRCGGDWQTVTAACGLPEEWGESITRDALGVAWDRYADSPWSGV